MCDIVNQEFIHAMIIVFQGSSKTALHFAAEAGHVAVVQQLVAKLDQTEDKTELRNYVATPDKVPVR